MVLSFGFNPLLILTCAIVFLIRVGTSKRRRCEEMDIKTAVELEQFAAEVLNNTDLISACGLAELARHVVINK